MRWQMNLWAKTGTSALGESSGRASNPRAKDQKSDSATQTRANKIRRSPPPTPTPSRTLRPSLVLSIRWADFFINNTKTKRRLPGFFSSLASGRSGQAKVGAGTVPGAGPAHPEAAVMAATISSLALPAAWPQRHFEHLPCFPVSLPRSSLLLRCLQAKRLPTQPGLPGACRPAAFRTRLPTPGALG